MNTFAILIILFNLGRKTFAIFGCFNVIVMSIIWFVYPEPAGRSLEEFNLLFTSDNILVSANMREYHRRVEEAGGSFVVAERRLLDEVDGETASLGGMDAAFEEKEYPTKTGVEVNDEAGSETSNSIEEKQVDV